MKEKEKYIETVIEIIRFQNEDVIVTSGEDPYEGGDEDP
jgi:hypothetical protein